MCAGFILGLAVCVWLAVPVLATQEFHWVVEPVLLEQAHHFSDGLAAVSAGGWWGFIDKSGTLVIDWQFSGASNFVDGLAAVRVGNMWGFIDRAGTMIVEPQFSRAFPLSGDLGAVFVRGLWGIIDRNGTMIVEPQFEDINGMGFSEGLVSVRVGTGVTARYGFIDTSGTVVIEPQFNSVGRGFSYGLAAVQTGILWGFINTAGEMIVEPQFIGVAEFTEGLAAIALVDKDQSNMRGQRGFIDTNGNMVIEPQFGEVLPFSDGVAAFSNCYDTYGWMGYLDRNGNIIIELVDTVSGYHFNENLARANDLAKSEGGWGFIDRDGNWAIEPQFDRANNFSEGIAAVRVGDFWGYIALGPAPASAESAELESETDYNHETQPVESEMPDDSPETEEYSPEPEPTITEPQPEPAATNPRTIRLAIGSITYTDNNTPHTLETAPFIADGRTMVPLSAIADILGASDVSFNGGVVSFSLNGRIFTMAIDEPLAGSFGTPVLIEGRVFVPLAYVINEMGAHARWDGNTRAIYIYTE